MEPNVKKELNDLKTLVQNWADAHLRLVDPAGGNEHIVEDFQEVMAINLAPYLQRLVECEHLTKVEYRNFCNHIVRVVVDFTAEIKRIEDV